jgi:cellulose biosynthesis protein BcsQ
MKNNFMNKLAFISQSGNVMKSTLAAATALEAIKNDINVAVADLDVESLLGLYSPQLAA